MKNEKKIKDERRKKKEERRKKKKKKKKTRVGSAATPRGGCHCYFGLL
jgi:hypothetical protein